MLDSLTLDQMRTFVAVVESGSFRAGAVKLARVQSAVSHAIANLEAELQVKLFDRSNRKPELTEQGRALLADARAILVKVDAMRARARGLGKGLELSLSVAVDPLVPLPRLAAVLEALRQRYPSVGVSVRTLPLASALHALVQNECTLAVTSDASRGDAIECEYLAPLPPFVAICGASHPLASQSATWSAEQLADYIQIVVTDPSPMTAGRDFGVLSPGTWRVSDLATKLALIRAGTGWGNMPLWMVEDDLESGRLVRVSAAALGSTSETALTAYLLWRIDTPLGPAARHLRELLLAAFATIARPD